MSKTSNQQSKQSGPGLKSGATGARVIKPASLGHTGKVVQESKMGGKGLNKR